MLSGFVFKRCISNLVQKVTMITGDGAHPYIIHRLIDVLNAVKAPLQYDVLNVNGQQALDSSHMNSVIESVKRNKVALKGKWTTNIDLDSDNEPGNICSPNMMLRKKLDLWADVVRVKSYPSFSLRNDIDFVIVRQNTEGEYSSIEHQHKQNGIAEMFKVTTRHRCQQIAKFAFELAANENRGTVHCIHKANIIKMGDGMFLDECEKISKNYPNINFKSMIIDNCSMQLVKLPQQFNVIVAPNLYGSIIINISSGLVGSNQILSGSNYSSGRQLALFEAATRSSCDYGKDAEYSNPMAMLHACCDMLNHLGYNEMATKISSAIKIVVANDIARTPDINGGESCEKLIDAVIYEISHHV